jgi:hypothetical protein
LSFHKLLCRILKIENQIIILPQRRRVPVENYEKGTWPRAGRRLQAAGPRVEWAESAAVRVRLKSAARCQTCSLTKTASVFILLEELP